ncbi:hypothetical protein OF83DRAFT_1170863 [Amylostereum chailletii]|nr:hypothetical protein OF83DRAFT_1170863 [Amylostereum chailletii]
MNDSHPHSAPPSSMSHRPSHHGRKPSFSSPISWLTRTSSSGSQSAPYARAAKPMRISEPKLFDPQAITATHSTASRGGLGTGALVVRTPQEALAGSGVTVDYIDVPVEAQEHEMSDVNEDDAELDEQVEETLAAVEAEDAAEDEHSEYEVEDDEDEHESKHESGSGHTHHVPPAYSPPRTVLPLSKSTPTLPLKPTPPCPTRAPPPPPPPPLPQVPAKEKRVSPPTSLYFPSVPPLPVSLSTPPPQPPFDVILLSPAPSASIDPAKVIVMLETCSATHRTTLATLVSRPSHMSAHLNDLLQPPAREQERAHDVDAASIHSQDSAFPNTPDSTFHSIFQQHLASSGLLPSSSSPSTSSTLGSMMHVFLDRPSTPYEHILSYLRSPPATVDHSPSLPSALQLLPPSPSSTTVLVAVRDEAQYLGLSELAALCITELRARHVQANALSKQHSSMGSQHSRGPSAGSLCTLREDSPELKRDSAGSSGSGSGSNFHRRFASRERTGHPVEVVIPPLKGSPPASLRSARPIGNWL